MYCDVTVGRGIKVGQVYDSSPALIGHGSEVWVLLVLLFTHNEIRRFELDYTVRLYPLIMFCPT